VVVAFDCDLVEVQVGEFFEADVEAGGGEGTPVVLLAPGFVGFEQVCFGDSGAVVGLALLRDESGGRVGVDAEPFGGMVAYWGMGEGVLLVQAVESVECFVEES